MSDSLQKLIDAARSVVVSASEREAQRRSFAYGNTHFENDLITRDMIDRAAEKLDREAQEGR